MPRRLPFFLALLVAAPAADAQIVRLPPLSEEPALWVAFGAGYTGINGTTTVQDGPTASTWAFGGGAQLRATIEKPVSRQVSIGALYARALLPLSYTGRGGSPTGCDITVGCTLDAHAAVENLALTLHYRARRDVGFHQVIDVSAGAQRYSAFRADEGDQRLAPDQLLDPQLTIGYGFGFDLSPTLETTLVQDYAATFHRRTDLPGSSTGVTGFYTLRLGLRVGLGSQTGR